MNKLYAGFLLFYAASVHRFGPLTHISQTRQDSCPNIESDQASHTEITCGCPATTPRGLAGNPVSGILKSFAADGQKAHVLHLS